MSPSKPAAARRPPLPPEDGSRLPVFNDAESPLAWLRSRRDKSGKPMLSREQFLAGERLRADYERSCIAARVAASGDTAGTDRGSGPRAADPTEAALAARQRFHYAMEKVGPELASILRQVCCMAAGIEQAERILDLPPRSGRAVLGLALTALARHYGYVAGERAASAANRHWAVEGYRPAIQFDGES
jgi:hypothetical protein